MFLAHKSTLENNSYIPLEQYKKRKILAKDEKEFIVSNICPHQGSLISTDRGIGNRRCPFHSWAFDINGNPLGSGRTSGHCQNKDKLKQEEVFEWNSLLFSEPVNFKTHVDFSRMNLIEQRIDVVDASARNIMDLFLDVDHIPSVHPGVYDRIGLNNKMSVSWDFCDNGSIQTVYDVNGNLGAVWIAMFPYTMVEWQPGALFITTAVFNNENSSSVYVFKYRDSSSADSNWELNNDVWETAWEQDKKQAAMLTGFTYKHLEVQKIHYRTFLNSYGTN
jgi:phenylpropionate dioxygenase-like ring-hydroxylating dioxygenase large terminal subunit